MEITKVVKAFHIREWPNTFGNIVYVKIKTKCVLGFHDTLSTAALNPKN